MPKIRRNAPCPCGSGKKYKKCCLRKHQQAHYEELQRQAARARAERERIWKLRRPLAAERSEV